MAPRFLPLTAAVVFAACNRAPPEQVRPPEESRAIPTAAQGASQPGDPATAPSGRGGKGPDPLNGKFPLSEALAAVPGAGAPVAKIETSKGTLTCKLFEDKAPITVANFIGLATGKRPFRDPATREWVSRPAYDGTTFHRIIKGFMIQGGDPKGDGTGEPGYVFPDEIWAGSKHDRAGQLCMANRGPNTNGAQFFITDAAAAHLDEAKSYTIFGACEPLAVVTAIASVPVDDERPKEPVVIRKVTIEREKAAAKAP
jgi:peptidyl-prolyl cis-trans isomerase A (cyclophilin A)